MHLFIQLFSYGGYKPMYIISSDHGKHLNEIMLSQWTCGFIPENRGRNFMLSNTCHFHIMSLEISYTLSFGNNVSTRPFFSV